MTRTVIQNTLRGLLAVAVIFVLNLGAMGFISYRLTTLDQWTIHTHKVIETLKDSLNALLDVETGDRGYVISKNADYLEPYRTGKVTVYQFIDQIDLLTKDNPEQQRLLATLRRLAADKVEFADLTIAGVDSGHGAKLISEGRGKRIMDEYRKVIAAMIANETELLDRRSIELQQVQLALWVGIVVMSICGSVILGWVYRITRTAIEEEKERVVLLNDANQELQSEIDRRVKTERALKEATIKLTSSNEDLQKFAYVASHDLQEPLRAVAGFVTLLANKHKGQLDEESETWIKFAVEGSQRMRTLINDLLAYSRVEPRGREPQDTDCSKIFAQALKNLSVLIEETGADVSAAELPTLPCDEGQLVQVFQNLIGNAIKFRGENKAVVRVEAAKQGKDWLFTVKDNGIGFDTEHAQRIFVIFQRLHGREEYEGTGIGLAITKKIIERHGGRIWAESEQGKGSTFFFTLPASKGENDATKADSDSDG